MSLYDLLLTNMSLLPSDFIEAVTLAVEIAIFHECAGTRRLLSKIEIDCLNTFTSLLTIPNRST